MGGGGKGKGTIGGMKTNPGLLLREIGALPLEAGGP